MTAPVITTQGLTKKYGDAVVVDNVDLTVPAGCVYGFMGLNGAGKSTTMKMLLGLVRPTSGSIDVFGTPLVDNLPAVLAQTGSLIEGPSYYPQLTGAENLSILQRLLGLPAERVPETLSLVGLAGAADKQARAYSLGMKQRLGIAMALLAHPRLLVLDEPTNGLDPAGIHEIRELLVHLAHERGVSVLVSTHLLSEIDLMADVVGIIHEGALRFQGPLEDLRDTGRLEIRTSNPQGAQRIIADLIRVMPSIGEDPAAVTLPGAVPDAACAAITRSLVAANIDVFSVAQKRRTLEEVFLELTGADRGAAMGVTA